MAMPLIKLSKYRGRTWSGMIMYAKKDTSDVNSRE